MDEQRLRTAHWYPGRGGLYLCGLQWSPTDPPAPPDVPRCVVCVTLRGEPIAVADGAARREGAWR